VFPLFIKVFSVVRYYYAVLWMLSNAKSVDADVTRRGRFCALARYLIQPSTLQLCCTDHHVHHACIKSARSADSDNIHAYMRQSLQAEVGGGWELIGQLHFCCQLAWAKMCFLALLVLNPAAPLLENYSFPDLKLKYG